MFRARYSALLLFLGLLCAGCSSASAAGLPAISETSDSQRLGSFVWFDLLTPDRAQARSYYARLLGWEISEAGGFPGYDLISNQRLMIGGIAQVAESEQATWLGSFSVDDVGNAARRVKQLGGRILEPVQSIDDRGVMALVEDDAGAVFVLLDTGSRDPKLRPVRQGDWLWIDLFTRNPVAASEFYQGLAALRLNTFTNQDGSQSDVLMSGGAATAGVVEIPWKHVDPIWLPYVRVDDVDATIERSTQLGGRLFYRWGDGAIILDPTGAAFGIQQVSNKGGQGQ